VQHQHWRFAQLGYRSIGTEEHATELETNDAVTAELVASRTISELLQCLSRAIAARTTSESESASARLARRAARMFEATETRVETVAQHLGVTARRPKEFARGVRLQRAIRESERSKDWGLIARLGLLRPSASDR